MPDEHLNCDPHRNLWWVLDVETTGLNPHLDDPAHEGRRDRLRVLRRQVGLPEHLNHFLLQVAAQPLTADLTDLPHLGVQDWVIAHTPDQVEVLREHASDYVRDMHDRTGLWDRLTGPDAVPLPDVARAMTRQVTWAREWLADRTGVDVSQVWARPAGNSLDLDLVFLRAFCPQPLQAAGTYRFADVTGLSTVLSWWGLLLGRCPVHVEGPVHDARVDVTNAILELRWMRNLLLHTAPNLLQSATPATGAVMRP